MKRVICVWFPTFSADLVWRRLQRRQSDWSGNPHTDEGAGLSSPASSPGGRTNAAKSLSPWKGPLDPPIRSRPLTLLTRRVASRELVAALCARCARAGITVGMDLAQARTLLPPGVATDAIGPARLHLQEHRPDRDAAALYALACWMTRFAPTVAPDAPDAILLDMTGTQRVHGGEPRLLRAIAATLARMGFLARVASAPTFTCAWGVAHFGPHDLSLVPPGRERDALADLPTAALNLDPATILALDQIGITRIGEVLALKRPSLAARFDPILLDRLDKALGRTPEVIEGVRPEPPLRAELLFDGPTDHWESVEAATRRVVEDMAHLLEGVQRGARRLAVELTRPDADPERFEIALSRPSRNVRHLWLLVRASLEKIDLGQGVEGVTLIALRTARVRHRQATSPGLGATSLGGSAGGTGGSDDQTPEAVWGELVDTLVGRLGADGVLHVQTVESHLPEHAFRHRSAMCRSGEPSAGGDGSNHLADRIARTSKIRTPWTTRFLVAPTDRPTVLFPPEPVDVLALTPDGPVLEVGWRGQRRRVLTCTGPERIAPEWWRWGAGDQSDAPAASPGATKGVTKDEMKVLDAWKAGHGGCGGGCGRSPPMPPPPPDRDYFAVQLEEGRWVWLCRQVGAGRWYAQGEWG